MTPSSSTTMGWRKPNARIDAATASTAASLRRGLFSYGRMLLRERISRSIHHLSLLQMTVFGSEECPRSRGDPKVEKRLQLSANGVTGVPVHEIGDGPCE